MKQKPQPAADEKIEHLMKKLAMEDDEDENEQEDHIHQEGCCSCHSNIGK